MEMALHHTELQGPISGVDEADTVQLTVIGLSLSGWTCQKARFGN